MKKFVSLALSLIFVLALVGCGESTETPKVTNDGQVSESSVSEKTVVSEKTEVSFDESWREFLEDYEEWVDDYVELVKKYNANPTDITILNEYTAMAAEMAEWADKADNMEEDLDAEDLAEYTATLARILDKLNKILE